MLIMATGCLPTSLLSSWRVYAAVDNTSHWITILPSCVSLVFAGSLCAAEKPSKLHSANTLHKWHSLIVGEVMQLYRGMKFAMRNSRSGWHMVLNEANKIWGSNKCQWKWKRLAADERENSSTYYSHLGSELMAHSDTVQDKGSDSLTINVRC